MFDNYNIFFFTFQFIVGFFSFLLLLCCESATASFRANLVPIHSTFGITTFVMAIATACSGLTEKAFFTLRYAYYISLSIFCLFLISPFFVLLSNISCSLRTFSFQLIGIDTEKAFFSLRYAYYISLSIVCLSLRSPFCVLIPNISCSLRTCIFHLIGIDIKLFEYHLKMSKFIKTDSRDIIHVKYYEA